MLPSTQFPYREGVGTCDALSCVSHIEEWAEARIVQIDFSAAFGMVNHRFILYKLCSVGIGGSVLSILTQFLSYRNTLWWTVVGVNWLTLCRECRRVEFCACYCSSCRTLSFFTFWRISDRLCRLLHFDG